MSSHICCHKHLRMPSFIILDNTDLIVYNSLAASKPFLFPAFSIIVMHLFWLVITHFPELVLPCVELKLNKIPSCPIQTFNRWLCKSYIALPIHIFETKRHKTKQMLPLSKVKYREDTSP